MTDIHEGTALRLQEDSQKLITQLVPDSDCLKSIQTSVEKHLIESLKHGGASNSGITALPKIRLIDTYITDICTHKESGTFYCLSIESIGVRITPVTIRPPNRCILHSSETIDVTYSSQEKLPTSIKPLVHEDITATVFVKTVLAAIELFINATKEAKKKETDNTSNVVLPNIFEFVMVSTYLLDKSTTRYELFAFHELAHKHLQINDPLIGVDLMYLCNVQLSTKNIPATIVQAISTPAAILLSTSFEASRNQPPCLVAADIGERIQFSYFEAKADEYKFHGYILDVDASHFNGNHIDPSTYCLKHGLPYTAADFEIKSLFGKQEQYWRDFEKMICAAYIPEICRKSIVRLFQTEAPPSAWVPNSLSLQDCLAILNDTSELKIVDSIMKSVWGWNIRLDQLHIIKKVIVATLTRSAALVAIYLSVIAKRTGKLQPALGGVTIALSGSLGGNYCYHKLIRFYLDKLFNRDTSNLIQFYQSSSGAIKGAALYGKLQKKKQ